MDLPLEEGLRVEQWLANPMRDTDDVAEGMAAFKEKRDPNYQGR
jgi:enoyl-CoA hydratase/carnithine racemase